MEQLIRVQYMCRKISTKKKNIRVSIILQRRIVVQYIYIIVEAMINVQVYV